MSLLRYKFLCCTLAFCCLHAALKAQLALGVKGSVAFVGQEASSAPSSWRSTGNVGLAVNLYIAEFSFGGFALQPEALYSNKGGIVQQQNALLRREDGVEKLRYVEVPLGLIYLLNFGSIVPYISAAPYYAFLLSQRSELRGQEAAVDTYRGGDYGVKLGGGVELKRFQLSAAYSHGLCDVSKGGKGVYNRGVEVSLGYFFLNNY